MPVDFLLQSVTLDFMNLLQIVVGYAVEVKLNFGSWLWGGG